MSDASPYVVLGATGGAGREACTNAAVVYHCLNVPYDQWASLLPTLIPNSMDAAARADAFLIITDNLYMYGPTDGPMTEETPRTPAGRKGKIRVPLENTLLDARRHRSLRRTGVGGTRRALSV